MKVLAKILRTGNTAYYRLVNADGKAWILPTRHLRIALELYQPSGRRGILLKRLLPLLHRFGFVRRRLQLEVMSVDLDAELLQAAELAFQTANLEFSIFEGTPSVHQKVTIQFFSGNKILGYGKVTTSEDIYELFRDEAKLLGDLHGKGITGIPAPLFCGELKSNVKMFIQSTSKTRNSFSPSRYTNFHEEFLTALAARTAQQLQFEDTDFYATLQSLKHLLHTFPESLRRPIADSLMRVTNHYEGQQVEFSAYHADFTPWNMFIGHDRLFVFDWEYGRSSYPPLLDRYHFFIQQAIHVGHLSSAEISRRMQQLPWYDAIQMQCYLLDMISRYVAREKGEFSPELLRLLEVWTKLLESDTQST